MWRFAAAPMARAAAPVQWRGGPLSAGEPPGYSPREILLAASARAVLAAFREPLEQKKLSAPATATLRVLEAALELYGPDVPLPPEPPPPA